MRRRSVAPVRARGLFCGEIECGEPCTDPDPSVWADAREDGFWTCEPCSEINGRLDDARGEALAGEKVRPIRWARQRGAA